MNQNDTACYMVNAIYYFFLWVQTGMDCTISIDKTQVYRRQAQETALPIVTGALKRKINCTEVYDIAPRKLILLHPV